MLLTFLNGIGWMIYNPYVLVFSIFCTVFDLIYIGLILNHMKKEKNA